MTITSTDTNTDTIAPSTVDRFLAALEAGVRVDDDVLAEGVHLDATVPNWRFGVVGRDVQDQYAAWFAHPGRFEELRRLPTTEGEVVVYFLSWEEDGKPWAAHHTHVLTLDGDGRIANDTFFCGGRWPSALLAEMGHPGHAC
jgi:hypothetical protein